MKTDTIFYLIVTLVVGALAVYAGIMERGYWAFGGGEAMITLAFIALYFYNKCETE